jgi:hypothetical protein
MKNLHSAMVNLMKRREEKMTKECNAIDVQILYEDECEQPQRLYITSQCIYCVFQVIYTQALTYIVLYVLVCMGDNTSDLATQSVLQY